MTRVARLGVLAALALVLTARGSAPARADGPTPNPVVGAVEAFTAPGAASEAGLGWQRVFLPWPDFQLDGPHDWQPSRVSDAIIDGERAAGREVVGLVVSTPQWAAGDGGMGWEAVPRGLDLPYDDPDNPWGQFMTRLAAQYAGRIDRWIVWNEPDVWSPDLPGRTWAGDEADYAALLRVAYHAVKRGNPAASVHLAGFTYWHDVEYGRRPFLLRLLDTLADDPDAAKHGYYFDVATVHAYFNPDQVYDQVRFVRNALARHGLRQPIWVNETNAPPSDDPAHPLPTARFPVTQAEQAAFILQAGSLALAAGAERVAVYKLWDGPLSPDMEPFGLLRTDHSPRPALAALRRLAEHSHGLLRATRQQMALATIVTLERGDAGVTTVAWARTPRTATVFVPARRRLAALYDEEGEREAARAGGGYWLTLPGAACGEWRCAIGGPPVTLVQSD